MADVLLPEVFTARDVARAAGVDEEAIAALIEAGLVRTLPEGGRVAYLEHAEAVRIGRALAHGLPIEAMALAASPAQVPFSRTRTANKRARVPFAISTAAHAALVGVLAFATVSMGAASPVAVTPSRTDTRLVFLAIPGPGGGGGGGGNKSPAPTPKAQRRGARPLSSPIPSRVLPSTPPPSVPPPKPEAPPVEAPVVEVPSDDRDQPGALEDTPAPVESRGPGENTGAGSGVGEGVGEGKGDGLGDGEEQGTGGGPYRPGSGVAPPTVLREIKPQYTEAARQRGIQGDVLLEIVVRRDGSVGDVRIVQGLGYGLDQRAVEAVRQWRFQAAARHGVPVDVLVEVAMEFRLR
jgi:protein TonB